MKSSKSTSTAKSAKKPDALAKSSKIKNAELRESDLEKATGGTSVGDKWKVTSDKG